MVNKLSERLRKMRLKSGLSQRQAANRLYISPSIISAYENGERTPSAENLLALSFLYKCSVDYLLGKAPENDRVLLDITDLDDNEIRILSELVENMKSKH